jgi:hypothetical protein
MYIRNWLDFLCGLKDIVPIIVIASAWCYALRTVPK